jgi:hypothetical protein
MFLISNWTNKRGHLQTGVNTLKDIFLIAKSIVIIFVHKYSICLQIWEGYVEEQETEPYDFYTIFLLVVMSSNLFMNGVFTAHI